MQKIILYNPSVSTMNIGDEIIFESIYKEIEPIIKDSFNLNVSTHLPISHFFSKIFSKADKKFVCGTNLLRNRLGGMFRQWDINFMNAKKLGPCILIGVGWQQDNRKLSSYTKGLYRKILDKQNLHSVRDNYTKQQLEKLGFKNVINTGCATMWRLTPEFCETIPQQKANKVIFTLTDYNRDCIRDVEIVDVLKKEYEEVYLWLQGYSDYDYAKNIGVLDKVTVIKPSLIEYDNILKNNEVDYIGTRLHGGVRALQHGRRTMIIAVDKRALEKKKDFNLPVVERKLITKEELQNIIYEKRKTEIIIPQKEIETWKKFHGII